MAFKATLGALALAGAMMLPAAAAAQNGQVTTTLNLRAGPGTEYPVIVTIPYGGAVSVYGCMQGWNWCDISWAGYRGWAYGSYVAYRYEGRYVAVPRYGVRLGLPILSFNFTTYANRHYRNLPWYRDRWDDGYWVRGHWTLRGGDRRYNDEPRRRPPSGVEDTRRHQNDNDRKIWERDNRRQGAREEGPRREVNPPKNNKPKDTRRAGGGKDSRMGKGSGKGQACKPNQPGCGPVAKPGNNKRQGDGRRQKGR